MHKETKENYLKMILMLAKKSKTVRNVDLASALGVSKPSVTKALHQLAEEGYIKKDTGFCIELTGLGTQIAEDTIKKHMVFLELLTSQGVPEDIAEQDACLLEHDVSAESFEAFLRINDLLKETGRKP